MTMINKKKDLVFKNKYSQMGRKEEFDLDYSKEDMTDQSQAINGSITEMAKKYGIDAIIAKAEQMQVNDSIKDQLYGNDYTLMFNSTEELLNTKKRIKGLFESIPARIRKEVFNDDIAEFLNGYTTNDINKLKALNKIGIVSDTQIKNIEDYNKQKQQEINEQITKQKFIKELEAKQGDIYEQFKKTGNISINFNTNNSGNSESVQNNI